MPSPFYNGGSRPPGPPHNLIFGFNRSPGPPHNLIFGVDYGADCIPDWEDLDGNPVDVNFAKCSDAGPDLNALAFSWESDQTYIEPIGSAANFTWEYSEGDFVAEGGSHDVNFDCCEGAPEPTNIGPFDFVAGEELTTVVSRFYLLDVNVGTGETIPNFTFTTFPVVLMSANAYEGATLSGDLRTDMAFVVDVGTGETIPNFTFTTFPAVDLAVVGNHEGATLVASVEKYTFVGHLHHEGATLSGDLEIDPYEGLVPEAFHGEELTADLQYSATFQPRFYSGATATATLATESILAANMSGGETLTVTFTNNPPWNPTVDFATGETLVSTLNLGAFSLGSMLAHEGGLMTVVVEDRPAANFVFTMNEGGTATLSMSFAANLGVITAHDGATLVPETIDFDEIWRFHDGVTVEATISTIDTIRPFAYEGTRLEFDLTTGPSQGVGFARAYEGGAMSVTALSGLVAVNLAVNFTDSYVFMAGLPYLGTHFDLDVSCCTNHAPGQQDFHDIEMEHEPLPDEHFDGERIDIDIDLSTNVRFQFNCYAGEAARTVDTVPYILGANMADGAGMTVNFEADLNFRLCPGNFIPDGDNVYVELDFTDTDDCSSNFAYTGERMSVSTLQVFQNFQPQMTEGQNLVFTLTVPEIAFAARAYTGEVMLMPIEFAAFAYEGARAFFSFYEAPVLGYSGEAASVDVVIKYDVRFLEVGCLENEYIYQDENGDPIPEKFNPVPVELDPYQHDLKALCF